MRNPFQVGNYVPNVLGLFLRNKCRLWCRSSSFAFSVRVHPPACMDRLRWITTARRVPNGSWGCAVQDVDQLCGRSTTSCDVDIVKHCMGIIRRVVYRLLAAEKTGILNALFAFETASALVDGTRGVFCRETVFSKHKTGDYRTTL